MRGASVPGLVAGLKRRREEEREPGEIVRDVPEVLLPGPSPCKRPALELLSQANDLAGMFSTFR